MGTDDDAGGNLYAAAGRKIDEIEQEMRRIGMWQEQPLAPEAYQFSRAFAGDTMAYNQWLQFVLVPRVRQVIEQRGNFPRASQVGAQAVREFDGMDDADRLTQLLSEFDDLFAQA